MQTPPSSMDERQQRGILSRNFFRHQLSFPTRFNFFSLKSKTLSRAPQAIADAGASLFGMLPGARYVAGRLQEVRDPRTLRCWSSDEVHECHRELGILHGYRSENCSVLQAMFSLFQRTNETMNFWTHFLPSIYFVWLFFSLALAMPLFSDDYLLPFTCYMTTSCAYPFMSCFAHAFSCLSRSATHVCYFMDYATLSLYSWGAAILYYNYVFPSAMFRSIYAELFLPVAAFMAVFTTFMACSSRLVWPTSSSSKFLRLGSFVIPYLWVSAPLIWRLLHCDHLDDACAASRVHHIRQFFGVFLASFFYGSHIPERFAPGKFDFVGHSHNLLHLFGVVATYEQMTGAFIDLQRRRRTLESARWASSSAWVMVITPLIVVTNGIIIFIFVRKLKIKDDSERRQKNKLPPQFSPLLERGADRIATTSSAVSQQQRNYPRKLHRRND